MTKQEGMRTLCFGGQDWWYHNRGHVDIQLMRKYARAGRVLYVNSIVMQRPKLSQGRRFVQKLIRKSKSIFQGLKKVEDNFWVYSPISLPLHHRDWSRALNTAALRAQVGCAQMRLRLRNPIVWVVCPAACDVALGLRRAKLVYLKTDAYELYPNVDETIVRRYDQRLKANADLTLFVSRELYNGEAAECRRALFLDHGVDYDLFAAPAAANDGAPELAEVKHPVVGYFGSLDGHTVDYGLIDRVTDLLPDLTFVFVGRVYAEAPAFAGRKNVRMLGQKDYREVPAYGRCFDVAIMPWNQTQWVQRCNPIKLKEYLALGKPVVSTPFPELQNYQEVVYRATTPEEFAGRIRQALAEDCPDKIAARREKVAKSTWDSRAAAVLEELFGPGAQEQGR
jgi:glycosyltransferase involved in cell wall biosynthesis